MPALFDRRLKLTIANPVDEENNFKDTITTDVIEINGGKTDNSTTPGLRITADIKKSLEKEPNTSEIKVYNLSPTRRKSLEHKGVKCKLEAGYKGTGIQLCFQGDVRTVDHIREGADWATTLKLGDGERAWRFARVSESWAPQTAASTVLKTLANKLGLNLGNVTKKLAAIDKVYDQGWMAVGNTARALDKVVRALGKEWSVQDGELQLLDPYEALDLPIPEITPTTGLIGSPEMGSPATKGKPQLLKFKSLLLVVRPGGKVKLKSERYDGFVRVHKIQYNLDTAGGPYYSEFEASIVKS